MKEIAQELWRSRRWIGRFSPQMGEDWYEQVHQLDEELMARGLELAHESVYLLFDRPPGAILAGQGQCLVARSVIGPLSGFHAARDSSLVLKEWSSGLVFMQKLPLNELSAPRSWGQILTQAFEAQLEVVRSGENLPPQFGLVFERKLQGEELHLEVRSLFFKKMIQ